MSLPSLHFIEMSTSAKSEVYEEWRFGALLMSTTRGNLEDSI